MGELDNIQEGYNDRWSCPLTPAENRLKVAVRAGEKVFPEVAHEWETYSYDME
jgi:hypothetical protein